MEILRSSWVSYISTRGSAVKSLSVTGFENVALRVHSSKAASGSGHLSDLTSTTKGKDPCYRVLGVLQYSLRPRTLGGLHVANDRAKIVFATWEHEDMRKFVSCESIPRFWKTSHAYQRLRYRRSNAISVA